MAIKRKRRKAKEMKKELYEFEIEDGVTDFLFWRQCV